MALTVASEGKLGRGFVLLAPPGANTAAPPNPQYYDSLLGEVQRLRAAIYLGDGAIQPHQIHPDGRFIQRADRLSWHLLTLNDHQQVTAGIRFLIYHPTARYADLPISESFAHLPVPFKHQVQEAVETELVKAESIGFNFGELGAWVVREDLRCSTEAFRMLMMIYALSISLGGAIALSTATTRHNSASLLRRAGGHRLVCKGEEMHPYFDPHYGCDMELLCFDSRFPNPRFAGWIGEFRDALSRVPMIAPGIPASAMPPPFMPAPAIPGGLQ